MPRPRSFGATKLGSKAGRRADLGDVYFRSKMEANVARWLTFLKAQGVIEGWKYEPLEFFFAAIKRGVRFYKPDFRVQETADSHYWIEVKGYLDQRSKTALKRMAKFYPGERVEVLTSKAYRQIVRDFAPLIQTME